MSELKPRHIDPEWTEPVDESDFHASNDIAADENPADDAEDDEEVVRKAGRYRRRRRRRPGKRRRLTLAVLPTVLTLGNGVCGLAAIAIAVSTATLEWDLETKLYAAGLLIFGGMLFDALDGSAARLTGQASRFGAELDSLCDAVTFGVAPAVIVWRISDALPQRLTWAIGVLFAICVLLRLARFNVETPEDDDHEGFEGLPSPAAAGTLAAFAIAITDVKFYATSDQYPAWVGGMSAWTLEASHFFIPVLAALLAFLMVSRFRYPHVFAQLLQGRRTPNQIGQALFAVVGVVLLHWVALPLMLCYFSFGSPLRSLVRQYRGTSNPPPSDSDEQQPSIR